MPEPDRFIKKLKETNKYRHTDEINCLIAQREKLEERRQVLKKELKQIIEEIKVLDSNIQLLKERTTKGKDLFSFTPGGK